MAKITKTYSIDDKLYEQFEKLSDEKNLNKSSFIEGCINQYLNENDRGFTGKVYVLKTDPKYGVKIVRKDETFYYLNDGSKIPIILFMQMYKEVDQVDTEQFFEDDAIRLKMHNNSLSKTGYDGFEKINS